ncbi:MAG: glycosyltransferase family 2 protein, partial [Acidimicrobiales bacterium]
MPTHRRSPYLEDALASVRAQSWTDWELVLVDDGAPDPESLAAAVNGDERMRLVRQDHAGVAAARNLGVAESRGEILGFLDDDDVWSVDHLTLNVTALTANPEAVASYSDCARLGSQSPPPPQGPADRASVLSGNARPSMPNLTVRREVFESLGGFDTSLLLAEDVDLIVRLASQGPLVWTPTVTAYYRRHDQNITADEVLAARYYDRMVSKHLKGAVAAGDRPATRWLRRNRARSRRHYAVTCIRQARKDLRKGAVRQA